MKSSSYLSLGLLVAVVAWMLSGAFAHVSETESPKNERHKTQQKVKVLNVLAQEITREIVVQGELEPLREVELSAQTASRVVKLPVSKGKRMPAEWFFPLLAF